MDNKSVKHPKILFNFATRSRPQKALQAIHNIASNSLDKENYLILLSCDKDDESMFNKSFLTQLQNITYAKIQPVFDVSTSKIHAINRDIDRLEYDWDILVNMSDDMSFIESGFDQSIRLDFQTYFPDFDGNIHYNDGFTKDLICTMNITGRAYYNRFGYVYHPAYKSLFCDNEFTEVAQKMNKIQYLDKVIFRHNHPSNIGGLVDSQLKHTQSFWDEDEATYKRRRQDGYPN